jgi:CRISPR type IV-associated protein Csf3
LRHIRINAGPCKSYRIPLETRHLEEDRLTWWCVGDASAIRDLLGWITYLGKKRSVGLGKVRRWTVEPCVPPWGDGFPVVRDGQPMRSLPPDWPGLADDVERAYRVLGCVDGPYWDKTREEICAVPRHE